MTSDDYDKAYFDFHLNLLTAFAAELKAQAPFCLSECSQEDQDFLNELTQLPNIGGSEHLIQGQLLLCRIVAAYPHLMPLLPRDLLWFFGGDCLHYMPDEEIQVFQQLDEQRQNAKDSNEAFSYEKARLSTMGLH
jgi:hypothetical protein